MDDIPKFSASVVITTKNRKEELRTALKSVMAQTFVPELIVMDDGSTDGTAALVQSEFPSAILHRFETSQGLVVRRNQAARLARGEIIFSMDDDAVFSTPRIIEQTLARFDQPEIGAVAIPYIDVNKDPRVFQAAPDDRGVWITSSFIGTAHALRREIFLKLNGYREALVHQGEESDFCIRLLAAGYVVRLGYGDPIHHLESPKRDLRRMDFYGCRNSILFAWQNVPTLPLPLHLLGTTFNCLRWTFEPARFVTRMGGILVGYRDCLKTDRRPVNRVAYKRWRQLKRNGSMLIDSSSP